MPEPPTQRARGRPSSGTLGALVKGLIVAALLTASIRAYGADNGDARTTLLDVCSGLALLLLYAPSWKSAGPGRQRLLALGWPICVAVLLLIGGARYVSALESLTLWPWVYVFLAIAFGMVIWGHSLPKVTQNPPEA